jgi:hypothetical protein
MKDWNAEIKRDLTDLADGYYADNCPFWETMIAVREWVDGMEESGATLFGSKEGFLSERLRMRRQLEEARSADERPPQGEHQPDTKIDLEDAIRATGGGQ